VNLLSPTLTSAARFPDGDAAAPAHAPYGISRSTLDAARAGLCAQLCSRHNDSGTEGDSLTRRISKAADAIDGTALDARDVELAAGLVAVMSGTLARLERMLGRLGA
jgi:hypothetical protein